jgi:hypothetical protein
MYFCVPDGSVDNFSSKFTSTIQVAAVIQPGFNSEAAQSQHELFPAPSHQTLDKFTTNQFISAGKRCLAKTRVRHACACPICTYTHTQKEYKSAIFSVLYNVGEKVWNGRRLGHGLFFFSQHGYSRNAMSCCSKVKATEWGVNENRLMDCIAESDWTNYIKVHCLRDKKIFHKKEIRILS